jgi:hypothetical protein
MPAELAPAHRRRGFPYRRTSWWVGSLAACRLTLHARCKCEPRHGVRRADLPVELRVSASGALRQCDRGQLPGSASSRSNPEVGKHWATRQDLSMRRALRQPPLQWPAGFRRNGSQRKLETRDLVHRRWSAAGPQWKFSTIIRSEFRCSS